MAATTHLSLARRYLAGQPDVPGLALEWSAQLRPGRAQVRDRLIFWVGQPGGAGNAPAFARLGALLAACGAPEALCSLQTRLAPACLHQGLGVRSAGGAQEICLYLHHADPASGREHYDAWKWSPGSAVDTSRYAFHFLPCSAAGEAPSALVHPALHAVYSALTRDPRLAAMSGFWLRHRGASVDQVSLTFPWLPAAGDIPALTGWLPASLACQRLRHIAFNCAHATEPALTLYFSGALAGPWQDDAPALRTLANNAAARASAAIAGRGLDRLPPWWGIPAWQPPPPALGRAADTRRAAQVLPRLEPRLGHAAGVYLIGCGWGELAQGLWQRRRCRSIGITSDPVQFAYCAARGQRVRLGAPHLTVPPGLFDCIVVLDAGASPAWLQGLRSYARQVMFCTPAGEWCWVDQALAAQGAGASVMHA